MQRNEFDYFAWWKACVKELGISPSEAWHLDYCEAAILLEVENKPDQDASLMVNAQRELNGMPPGDLKNVN